MRQALKEAIRVLLPRSAPAGLLEPSKTLSERDRVVLVGGNSAKSAWGGATHVPAASVGQFAADAGATGPQSCS